jgi:histidyl-tRNA synthetase
VLKKPDICTLKWDKYMAQKPGIPKGTRDFSPAEVVKRQYIMNVIRRNFELFGFQPIETPSFENSSTLMGKYGDEGDRLIFKILNSGNYLDKTEDSILTNRDLSKLTPQISEKALRYDLTVPFARYVVQHRNELSFPFKRYQMQPVWRADRPQKGRFREFWQCDADVVGSKSLLQEVELIQLYDSVFSELGLAGATIKLNNRKILSAIATVIGASDKLIDFTVALDKLDKIGEEGVRSELQEKGIGSAAVEKLQPLFHMKGSPQEKLQQLESIVKDNEEGRLGISELKFVIESVATLGLKDSVLDIDVTLARGLNYYTGSIVEVLPPKGISMGSIGGGGRYDDLTGIFGLSNMSGVGISFGLDRIYLVLEELNLFPKEAMAQTKVLFVNYGSAEALYAMQAIKQLRAAGISAELYPDAVKVGKQLEYSDNRNIPFAVLAGDEEMKTETYTLKNLSAKTQENVTMKQLLERLK